MNHNPTTTLLREFRQAKGWTQEQAAAWYGCKVRSWGRYETGARDTPLPLLNRIDEFMRRLPRARG